MWESAGEHELLTASGRDPEAFEILFSRHAVRLRRWLAAQTGDVMTANDLLAETFAAAWLGRRRYHGDDDRTALAWLHGIAGNLLRQHYKRGRVESVARRRLGIDLGLPAEDELQSVLDRAEAAAVAPELDQALQELSSTQRAAVTGRVLRDLSYQELAGELGCTEQSARAHVSRGLRALRSTMRGARP